MEKKQEWSSWGVVISKEKNRENIVSIESDFQYSNCIKLCYISQLLSFDFGEKAHYSVSENISKFGSYSTKTS